MKEDGKMGSELFFYVSIPPRKIILTPFFLTPFFHPFSGD